MGRTSNVSRVAEVDGCTACAESRWIGKKRRKESAAQINKMRSACDKVQADSSTSAAQRTY